ncbi:hypothetical protein BH10PLA1_BH10PLA1_01370 [soil metagenome]
MIRNCFVLLVLASCGAALAQSATPAVEPTTAPTTAPAATLPADASTPKGALRMFFAATDAGDEAGIRSLLFTSSPTEEKLADTMSQMSGTGYQLQTAIRTTFGAEQSKSVLGDPAAAAKVRDQFLTHVNEQINGDSAVIQLGGASQASIEFRKAGDVWKIRVGKVLDNQKPQDVERNLAAAGVQIKVMRDMITEVTAGKFKTVDDVKQTLEGRVRQALMQLHQERAKSTTEPTTEPATQP